MDAFVSRGSSPFATAANTWEASPITGQKRTRVPHDVEAMDKADLVLLVKQLCSERSALEEQVSKKPKGSSTASASSSSSVQSKLGSAVSAPSASELSTLKKRLADKAVKAIRKTKHNDKRKPYTEVSEGMPSKTVALKLLEGLPMKSDTARLTRWLLDGDDTIAGWLGIEKLVHPVGFDGKVWCFGGASPKVYAWAGLESCEVKYEPASNLLTLKVRTFMAGSGRPEHAPRLQAYSRGQSSARPDPDGIDEDEVSELRATMLASVRAAGL